MQIGHGSLALKKRNASTASCEHRRPCLDKFQIRSFSQCDRPAHGGERAAPSPTTPRTGTRSTRPMSYREALPSILFENPMAAKFGTSEIPGRRYGSGREAWRRLCRFLSARDCRFKARGGGGGFGIKDGIKQAGRKEKVIVLQWILARFDPSRPSQASTQLEIDYLGCDNPLE